MEAETDLLPLQLFLLPLSMPSLPAESRITAVRHHTSPHLTGFVTYTSCRHEALTISADLSSFHFLKHAKDVSPRKSNQLCFCCSASLKPSWIRIRGGGYETSERPRMQMIVVIAHYVQRY